MLQDSFSRVVMKDFLTSLCGTTICSLNTSTTIFVRNIKMHAGTRGKETTLYFKNPQEVNLSIKHGKKAFRGRPDNMHNLYE